MKSILGKDVIPAERKVILLENADLPEMVVVSLDLSRFLKRFQRSIQVSLRFKRSPKKKKKKLQ